MIGQAVSVAIMQPYFLPYIGYWQLMCNVDVFVIYDDIEFTKKGWVNRNRFLLNGHPETFSLPIKKDSDFLDVCERQLSESFGIEKNKLIRRLEAAYRKAPNYQEGKALLLDIFACEEKNLFHFLYQSIELVRARLGINNRLVVSSTLGIPRQLKGQDRVIATCKVLGATDYINPIGGVGLYDAQAFHASGIRLCFQQVRPVVFQQFQNQFVPNLSIIDNIMFCGIHGVKQQLSEMDIRK